MLRISDRIRWRDLRKVTDPVATRIEEGLVRRGLLMERGDWFTLGFYSVVPLALLLLFGLAKVSVGLARERPVAFLVFFLVVTGATLMARWLGTDKRTRAGLAARMDAVDANTRLRQAHTQDETSMAVALFGTGILATSSLGDFHRMRTNNGSDGGSSSGGDGDGGGGGGGCGGCGS